MNWWRKLKKNSLARLGASLLLVFYLIVIAADFVAPYDPYEPQVHGSLLPPTEIYFRHQETGKWIGPHIYPTQQGKTDLETGKRELIVDFETPTPLKLFTSGSDYQVFSLSLPLPPDFRPVEIFSGWEVDWHLFGTAGEAKYHLLGTDEQGRDQFSRLVHGGRISLFIGLFGIAISFPLGMFFGGISGYFGGIIDAIIMRLVEVLMTIPTIYLLVALAAVLPSQIHPVQRFILIIIITSFVSWSGLARVVRGQVLSIKQREFVEAARAMGGNSFYIILRHVLPQTATYIIISATLAIPSFILAEAVLSVVGLGMPPNEPSWGNLLSAGTNASILVLHPWLVWPPAIVMILTVLAFNLLGDGLRDALDPR